MLHHTVCMLCTYVCMTLSLCLRERERERERERKREREFEKERGREKDGGGEREGGRESIQDDQMACLPCCMWGRVFVAVVRTIYW